MKALPVTLIVACVLAACYLVGSRMERSEAQQQLTEARK